MATAQTFVALVLTMCVFCINLKKIGQNPNSTKVFQSSILAENVSRRNEDETFPWGFRLSEQIQSPFPRNDNKVKNSKKTEYSNYIKVFFINIQFSLY
jgi:hypothetical protein